ncbi:hypothetical protein ACRAWF_03845 [Streptomyces sp. L7]
MCLLAAAGHGLATGATPPLWGGRRRVPRRVRHGVPARWAGTVPARHRCRHARHPGGAAPRLRPRAAPGRDGDGRDGAHVGGHHGPDAADAGDDPARRGGACRRRPRRGLVAAARGGRAVVVAALGRRLRARAGGPVAGRPRTPARTHGGSRAHRRRRGPFRQLLLRHAVSRRGPPVPIPYPV